MSKDLEGKWMYNFGDEEHWNSGEHFDTKEEAIKEGKIAAIENDYEQYQVGQIEYFIPFINADRVIEQISEGAYEECGEYAEDYLDSVSDEDEKELEEKLNEVLNDWLAKTKNYPSFYKITNTSDHVA